MSSSDHIFLNRTVPVAGLSFHFAVVLQVSTAYIFLTFITPKIQLLVNTFSLDSSFFLQSSASSQLCTSCTAVLCHCSVFTWIMRCPLLLLLLLPLPHFSVGLRTSPGFLSLRPQVHLGCFPPALLIGEVLQVSILSYTLGRNVNW